MYFILQENPPYNKGAFKVQIDFPAEYPFKPPKITFLTKIYHPNIDEKGQVCLPIISAENWKPATKTDQGWYFSTPRLTTLIIFGNIQLILEKEFLHEIKRHRITSLDGIHGTIL